MTIELIMNYDDSFLRMWIVIGMIHVEARKPRKEMRDSFTVIRIIYPITNEKKRKLAHRTDCAMSLLTPFYRTSN